MLLRVLTILACAVAWNAWAAMDDGVEMPAHKPLAENPAVSAEPLSEEMPADEGDEYDAEKAQAAKTGSATSKPPGDATNPSPPSVPAVVEYTAVQMQGLNKVTARISTLEGTVGAVTRFGNLEIIPRRCWKAPTGEQPENAALLEIWELKPGESPQKIFLGWMFSSSPGLSALENPVYDLTILGCGTTEEAGKEAPKEVPKEVPASAAKTETKKK